MDNARLKELASYNLGESSGFMQVEKFADMGPTARAKMLWQWATSKQMNFQDWQPYLQAHATECSRDMGIDEAAKPETKE